ncbi:MAG: spore coat associated protein CotJA [Clostridiaceae bacterium]|nr:spore coat associated protein CotJA [Eubacteriales bacterium]
MTVYKNSYARAKCGCACTGMCSTPAMSPADMENTVAAGMACEAPCTDICLEAGACAQNLLAQLVFPIQVYTYGFCPSDALAKGTFFPELVR